MNCDAKILTASGEEVCCTLGAGHGGNHANRIERPRKEFDRVRGGFREALPTTVFETRYFWADNDLVATAYRRSS